MVCRSERNSFRHRTRPNWKLVFLYSDDLVILVHFIHPLIAYIAHFYFCGNSFLSNFSWSKQDKYGKDHIKKNMYKNLQKDRKETVLRAQLSSTLSWKVRIGLKANKHFILKSFPIKFPCSFTYFSNAFIEL